MSPDERIVQIEGECCAAWLSWLVHLSLLRVLTPALPPPQLLVVLRSCLRSMESITANELAGLGVGALLLAAALATPKVDAFIARAQRRELKLCEECGGVTRIPCLRCRARGTLIEGVFGSSKAVTCSACRGKGNFPCPRCCVNNNKSSSSSSSFIFCRQWPRQFAMNASVPCAVAY